jgi:hypothetical protein
VFGCGAFHYLKLIHKIKGYRQRILTDYAVTRPEKTIHKKKVYEKRRRTKRRCNAGQGLQPLSNRSAG